MNKREALKIFKELKNKKTKKKKLNFLNQEGGIPGIMRIIGCILKLSLTVHDKITQTMACLGVRPLPMKKKEESRFKLVYLVG